VTQRARVAIVAFVVVAVAISLFVPTEDARTIDATTHGTMPWGYRAVHDLLTELGVSAGRFEDDVDALPASTTAWWLSMPALCLDLDDASDPTEGPRAWIASGGVGVVFLPGGARTGRCHLGAMALPPTRESKGNAPLLGLGPDRDVRVTPLRTFTDVDDAWIVRATRGGEPFVIERRLEDGTLVLVADARIVENRALADGDDALVAVDLVRAYGAPRVVEEPPWLLAGRARSTIGYLLSSPAIALLAGLALTALVVAWHGSLVPPRTIDGDSVPAPTLQAFVASLATLYAGSRDYPRLVARYRELTARRLRRHLGLPPHASLETVATRVERMRPALRARALLLERVDAPDAARFQSTVAGLDALAGEVLG
jgi:hypothetical protein